MAVKLSAADIPVTVAEAKPSAGLKFLMAGKSGLHITKDESFESFLEAFYDRQAELHPILEAFQARDVIAWAHEFGSETFRGSKKRAFPKAMNASTLFRAWLLKLST